MSEKDIFAAIGLSEMQTHRFRDRLDSDLAKGLDAALRTRNPETIRMTIDEAASTMEARLRARS